MDCTKCTQKGCRQGTPCQNHRDDYVEEYHQPAQQAYVKAASALVDHGRAGTLNRLEEIIEFIKRMGYQKVGVAYCYGMEDKAALLRKHLEHAGIKPTMVSCTVDGVTEDDVSPGKGACSVSCNPIGQAEALNRSGADFVLLMGLCLGHDILLQKQLTMDFTTFVVKDRVFSHNPIAALTR